MRGITFGTPYFETELGRVEPDSEIHFALALYAASCDPEIGVPRDELASLLWPDSPMESARHNLRQAMYRLRQLGIPVHLKVGQVVMSDTDTEIDLRELVEGQLPKDELLRIATLPFLPGYAPRLATAFNVWLEDLRSRVDRVRRHALVEAIRDARAQARFRDIHRLSPALLRLDPLNETGVLALVEALAMDGSKVEALRLLDEYEAEVGAISEALRLPARVLRRRVSECLDESTIVRRYEVPFVGRDSEYSTLRLAFLESRRGRAHCYVVTGEPGIGKTRIAHELLRVSMLDGAATISYSCTSGDAVSPLASLIALVGSLLAQPGALGCSSQHLQFLRRVQQPDSHSVFASGMASDVAYAQLVQSLAELTAAITEEVPLLILVDDAHRLHQTTWRILTDIVGRMPDKRLMVLLAARALPEWFSALGINGSNEAIRGILLQHMSREASRSFVSLWSEKHSVAPQDTAIERILDVADGNPFYLGSMLTHLAGGGSEDESPASIIELVQLQYNSLSSAAKHGLLVVALLQAHAAVVRVAKVLGVHGEVYVRTLDELESSGLIVAQGSGVRLRHDLIGDIALSLASAGVLQYLRHRIALHLERDGRRSGNVEFLSAALVLWESTGNQQGAFRTATALGERLQAIGLSSDASRAFERARANATTQSQHVGVTKLLCKALSVAGEWEALSRLHLGLRHSGNIAETEPGEIALSRVETDLFSRGYAPPDGMLEGVYSDAGNEVELRLRAATLAVAARDNDLRGEEYIQRHVSSLRRLIEGSPPSQSRYALELIVAACSFDESATRRLTEQSLQATSALPPGQRVKPVRHAAHALLRVGRTREAISLFESSLIDADQLKLRDHQLSSLEKLTSLSLHVGELERARSYASRFGSLVRSTTAVTTYLYWLCELEAGLAFVTRDRDLAAAALETLQALPQEAPVQAFQYGLFSSRCSLSFAFPELLDRATISWCHTQNPASLRRGGTDVSVLAVLSALARSEALDAASILASKYFGSLRVDQEPLSPALRRMLPYGLKLDSLALAALEADGPRPAS